jgi:hypothetical protein
MHKLKNVYSAVFKITIFYKIKKIIKIYIFKIKAFLLRKLDSTTK